MHPAQDNQPPWLFQLLIKLGKPWGLRWVGDKELAVIYQMQRYHDLRGPGFFWITPSIQAVRKIISLSEDGVTTDFKEILTADALPLEMTWLLVYRLDPRSLPKAEAQTVVNWTPDLKRTIVTEYAQRCMQAVLPKFDALTVCRGKVFQEIEAEFSKEINGLMNIFGMSLLEGRVLKVIPPPILQYRLEQEAQQAAQADARAGMQTGAFSDAQKSALQKAAQYPTFVPSIELRAEAAAAVAAINNPPVTST